MLKKTVTYTDFNGEEVTEDLYFHLSKAEMVELEMSEEGGLSNSLQSIIDAGDGKVIMAKFKEIILLAYGKRSPDGKHFTKNDQLREEFLSTEAYSALFMELVTNADSAAEFITGVVPKDLAEDAMKITQAHLRVVPPPEVPEEEIRKIYRSELVEMDATAFSQIQDDLREGRAVLVDDPIA